MDIAATEQDFPARHHHHAMLREQALENGLGFLVLGIVEAGRDDACLLYTSPSPRD